MILTILKDDLPQGLSFPLGAATLSSEIGEAIPLERLGLYLMYGSGRQRQVYDPLRSTNRVYPVMAIDRTLPELASLPASDIKLDHDIAVLVFPVKTLFRKAVTQAIVNGGMRSVRNWLSSVDEPADKKPLVLFYHEGEDRITSKFADVAAGRPRTYA